MPINHHLSVGSISGGGYSAGRHGRDSLASAIPASVSRRQRQADLGPDLSDRDSRLCRYDRDRSGLSGIVGRQARKCRGLRPNHRFGAVGSFDQVRSKVRFRGIAPNCVEPEPNCFPSGLAGAQPCRRALCVPFEASCDAVAVHSIPVVHFPLARRRLSCPDCYKSPGRCNGWIDCTLLSELHES